MTEPTEQGATCPTCGSRNPANRKREVDIDGVEFGKPCQHPFHDLPPLSGMSVPEVAAIIALSADPTPTPVSDDAVREALAQVAACSSCAGICDECQRALATLEAAIHQRDERIGELEADEWHH